MEELERLLLETGESGNRRAVYVWIAFEIIQEYGRVPLKLYDMVAAILGTTPEAIRKGIFWIVLALWKKKFSGRTSCPTTRNSLIDLADSMLDGKFI